MHFANSPAALAARQVRQVFLMRSRLGLAGNTLNVDAPAWERHDSGTGAGIDSYYEYLLKVGSSREPDRLHGDHTAKAVRACRLLIGKLFVASPTPCIAAVTTQIRTAAEYSDTFRTVRALVLTAQSYLLFGDEDYLGMFAASYVSAARRMRLVGDFAKCASLQAPGLSAVHAMQQVSFVERRTQT